MNMKRIRVDRKNFIKGGYKNHLLVRSVCLTATLVTAVFLLLLPSQTFAQTSPEWTGKEEVRSHQKINLKPGAAITFTIKFKNTGVPTWKNDGPNFVALATTDPEKRISAFKHAFWNEVDYRPGRLLESRVAPGEVGTFRFALEAPDALGDYEETFMAVAKNIAWIQGTKFTISLTVSTELPTPQPKAETQSSIATDYPVRDSAYAAEWVGGAVKTFSASPGQQLFHTFEVKNVGTATWRNEGSRFASLYTVRPNYHDSAMHTGGPGWISKSQIRISNQIVKPGETAKVVLLFKAPASSGSHVENIRLAAENYTWFNGGELKLVVNVDTSEQTSQGVIVEDEPQVSQPPVDPLAELYKDQSYEANFLISSDKNLVLNSAETITFRVGFKNMGQTTWRSSGNRYVSLYTIQPNYRVSRFATRVAGLNSGWSSTSQVKMLQDEVQPGQLAIFQFDLTAPTTSGVYTEQFRLAAEEHTWIKGGEFTLPITVQGGTGALPSVPAQQGPLGPTMRVGLFSSDDPFSLTADSPFEVRSGSGELLVSLPAKTEVRVEYNKTTGQYTVQSMGLDKTMSDYVVVQALDNNTITEILSFERRLPWNPVINENLFRGSVEIRHSNVTGETWAINILPMEHYLRGIAETSSSSPVEFLKVMTVAARTYGFYHYERQTKHEDEHFYVDSQFDQVYRGYALEKRHPSLTQAVIESTGEVVTYTDPVTGETKIAITPYYSWSDGRTRSWSEVWGGDVPWTQSVPVPHDEGLSLNGHGVGMSARGGLLMVDEDGKTYKEVLNYFFKGINIEDRY